MALYGGPRDPWIMALPGNNQSNGVNQNATPWYEGYMQKAFQQNPSLYQQFAEKYDTRPVVTAPNPFTNVQGPGTVGPNGGNNKQTKPVSQPGTYTRPKYNSKNAYSSDVFIPIQTWTKDDPMSGQYNQLTYDANTKKLTTSPDKYWPKGYLPSVKNNKLVLFDEKTGSYFDIDDKGEVITPGGVSGGGTGTNTTTTTPQNNNNNQDSPNPIKLPDGTEPTGNMSLNPDDRNDALAKGPLQELIEDKIEAEDVSEKDLYATINRLKQNDLDLLKKQRNLNTSQMITGSLASLPLLMAALNGGEPDSPAPPQISIPDLEFDNSIYRNQQNQNAGALSGVRNFLKQHGRSDLYSGAYADYLNSANQQLAQEATAKQEFLNQNAIQTADAMTKQSLANYEAEKERAATIDAANSRRQDVASMMMSQMLNNYFGAARANLETKAQEGKLEGVYAMLQEAIDQGDMNKFNNIMSLMNLGYITPGDEPIESVTEYSKTQQ